MRGRSVSMLVAFAAMTIVAAACGSDGGNETTAEFSARAIAEANEGQPLVAVVANSAGTLALGPNRIAIAFFASDGGMVHDVTSATLRLFKLEGDVGSFVSETPLTRSQLLDEDHHATRLNGTRGGALYVSDASRLAEAPRALAHDEPAGHPLRCERGL